MSEFQRYSAPGLPTWPSLLIANDRQRAVVTFRLATWKSTQRAAVLCLMLAWAINLFAGLWLWNRLSFIENPLGRGFLVLLGICLTAGFTRPLIPAAFRDCLSRRLFAQRSTIWFTSEAVAFCSRLYENGVVVPRTWQGQPVQVRFDTGPDPEASAELSQPPGQRGHASGLQTARILRMVISAFDPQRRISPSTQGPLARAIPMLPVDQHDAQRLTMVLAAAAELTAAAPIPTARPSPSPEAGLDIDAHRT